MYSVWNCGYFRNTPQFARNCVLNNYVGPPCCRAEMYAGRVACCPLVSHGEYDDGIDRRTEARTADCYTTLSARYG